MSTVAVPPMRPGVAVSGPFSRVAEDRDGRARCGSASAERPPAEAAHAQDRDVVRGVEGDDAAPMLPAVAAVDARVVGHPRRRARS